MNNKQMFVSLFVVYILFVSIFVVTAPAFAETNVRAGIIVEIKEDDDCVVVEDACGIFWEFYGVEDYMLDDLVIMELWDANTPESIYDDEIINVVYSGFVAADVK